MHVVKNPRRPRRRLPPDCGREASPRTDPRAAEAALKDRHGPTPKAIRVSRGFGLAKFESGVLPPRNNVSAARRKKKRRSARANPPPKARKRRAQKNL